MKIRHGMILAAGLGKRMQPLTNKKPKPLLEIGGITLLERAINLLINHGVKEISLNVHHLGDQIEKYISDLKSEVKIKISNEKDSLLDTGGGVKKGTKDFKENPFFVINPDTVWSNNYKDEILKMEEIYFTKKIENILLLVNKKKSFDKKLMGDFNLKNNLVSRDAEKQFIYTGCQIINKKLFFRKKKEIYSILEIWNNLLTHEKLYGYESQRNFYHLTDLEIFNKLKDH